MQLINPCELPPSRENFKRIILSGAAGSGKDYLKDKFGAKGFPIDISYTTRPMREGEIPGYTYKYVRKWLFKLKKFFGGFYEAVCFNGAYYGTAKKSWNKSVVFIMTPSGVAQISEEDKKGCVIVYLKIDEDIRRERMSKRSDNGFDKVKRRIEADNKDFEGFLHEADMLITDPTFDTEEVIKNILSEAYEPQL